MLVHTAKEVSAAMNIHHDALPLVAFALALSGVCFHLDPFSSHIGLGLPPLPPFASSNLPKSILAKLIVQKLGGFFEVQLRNSHSLNLDPLRMRHPLAGECL